MPAKLQFIPPKQKNPISIAFSDSYKRILRNFENNGYLKVERPDFHDIRQMRHWSNRNIAKPEHVSTKILRIYRTKLSGKNFEDTEGNLVTGPNSLQEGLHYMLHEMVDDAKSLEHGNPPFSFPLSDNTWIEGKYTRNTFRLTTNERGEIVKSEPSGGFDCWYTKYTPEKAIEILQRFEPDKTFAMIMVDGSEQLTVYNKEEWLYGDIDSLAEANKGIGLPSGQTYLTEEYGGLNRYLKYKAEKQKEGQGSSNIARPTKKRYYSKPEENTTNANSS